MIDKLADSWTEQEVRMIPLADIKTEERFQPRLIEPLPFRERVTDKCRLAEHVKRMAELLGDTGRQLEAIWLADLNGELIVLDGHHRLAAYDRAGRSTIPARVRSVDSRTAFMTSRLANLSSRAEELRPKQRLEACFAFLGSLTCEGRDEVPPKLSCRLLGREFGISHDTVNRMIQSIKKTVADIRNGWLSELHFAPGTEWPLWKYVTGPRGAGYDDVPQEIRMNRQIEKVAISIGKLVNKYGSEVLYKGLARYFDADDSPHDYLVATFSAEAARVLGEEKKQEEAAEKVLAYRDRQPSEFPY